MRTMTTVGWLLVAALTACKGDRDDRRDRSERAAQADQWDPAAAAPAAPPEAEVPSGGAAAAMALEEGQLGTKDADRAKGRYNMKPAAAGPGRAAGGALADDGDGENRADQPEGPTRAWFPETFLFEPLVVTDDSGAASVRVRVPDRLTSWRVLALAHSRSGAQGGATTSFLGTLPAYVDLVAPEVLVRGDVIQLPIQIVNTTETALSASLDLEVDNATVTGGGGVRLVPPQGSVISYARLHADRAGQVKLRVALRGGDALVRTIEVLPIGMPVTTLRTGTLAAPRTLAIDAPAGSDPTTDRARLLVFPGALALLRSELGVSVARDGVADNAYALLLAGRATALLAALGDEPDPEALRNLAIVTSQRAIRAGRNLDVDTATLLAEAALTHPGNPVLTRLGERAAGFLVEQQRPDGTFGGGTGWTLQRVLVATAAATRAVGSSTATSPSRQRAAVVALRASGAFERSAAQITDGFTAAAMLASGAVRGPLVDVLRTRVRDAIKASPDGARYLEVTGGVVRADGQRPSVAEATALAALALAGDPTAPLADLGATLLGSYDPYRGWGDGRTNLVAMQAVLELFKAPVPADVKITLAMDGTMVAQGVLGRDKLREVLALDVPAAGLAGPHTWTITADPPVAGLGYSLTLAGWVPWQASPVRGGLELALPPAVTAAVGKPTDVTLRAIAPSGVALTIMHALPAGVQVDTASLDALATAGTITRFKASTGKVELVVPALAPGQTFAASYRLIPTLAGTLHSPPSSITAGATEIAVPPTVWTVK